jgi:hypothetical protein
MISRIARFSLATLIAAAIGFSPMAVMAADPAPVAPAAAPAAAPADKAVEQIRRLRKKRKLRKKQRRNQRKNLRQLQIQLLSNLYYVDPSLIEGVSSIKVIGALNIR